MSCMKSDLSQVMVCNAFMKQVSMSLASVSSVAPGTIPTGRATDPSLKYFSGAALIALYGSVAMGRKNMARWIWT